MRARAPQAIGTKVEMNGGSAANTVCGVASLEGPLRM